MLRAGSIGTSLNLRIANMNFSYYVHHGKVRRIQKTWNFVHGIFNLTIFHSILTNPYQFQVQIF